jgi:cell division protein FtsL
MQATDTLNLGMKKAGEILDADLFWRGHLAKAVKRRDFKGTLWGVLALSLLLFFYVWQHMQVVKLSYEVQGLKLEKQQLTNKYYYLRYKMYDVNSLSRVEKVARLQLGMVTPRPEQIVILNDETSYYPKWFSLWTTTMKKVEKP